MSLAAPGEGLVTFYPGNNYAAGWGTSFSTPLVAGGAALLVQTSSGNINESQASRALSEAADVGQGLGAGRLDLMQATGYGNRYGYNH